MPCGGGRLRRADRLRDSRDFRRLSRHGQRAASGSFVALGMSREIEGQRGGARLGVTVSRRVGGAVTRNRVKRQIREWFRTQRGTLDAGLDLVVIARSGAGALGGGEVAGELTRLARKLGVVTQ